MTDIDSAVGQQTELTRPEPVPTSVDGLVCRPILQAGDVEKLTFVRTTDARTALARGLSEYLSQLRIVWEGGRQLQFQKVEVCWAEPERPAKFPSAVLAASQDASYEGSPGLGAPELVMQADGTKRYLRQVAELRQEFRLQVWATDPVERMGLTALLEDALNPAEFMTGLRLELPYYFGTRATYEALSLGYDDNSSDAQKRNRRSIITIAANIPVYRPVGELQMMKPKAVVLVSDQLDPHADTQAWFDLARGEGKL